MRTPGLSFLPTVPISWATRSLRHRGTVLYARRGHLDPLGWPHVGLRDVSRQHAPAVVREEVRRAERQATLRRVSNVLGLTLAFVGALVSAFVAARRDMQRFDAWEYAAGQHPPEDAGGMWSTRPRLRHEPESMAHTPACAWRGCQALPHHRAREGGRPCGSSDARG